MLRANLDLSFPGFHLLADIEIPATGVTAIFGASGSGKTTLLRCLAGLERAPSGLVTFRGQEWQDEARDRFLPPHRRALGYVFQESRLFSHLPVQDNLRYGWKRNKQRDQKISWDHVVSLLGLEALLDRTPGTLSGGERQRVAIGRALMTNPQLLLMDEPLASLDLQRKREILPFLERMVHEIGIPILYVSHSLAEILQLTNTVLLMDAGKVIAQGPIQEVLTQTQIPDSMGRDMAGAVIDATMVEHDATYGLATLSFQGKQLVIPHQSPTIGKSVRVHISSKDVSIIVGSPPQQTSVLNVLEATVTAIGDSPRHESSVDIQLDIGCPLVATITKKSLHLLQLYPGQQVWAQIKALALTDEMLS